MPDHLARLIENAGNPRILVVGDVMLDRYVWGQASRISAEGPIPILDVTSEEERPGGAGNVACALAHLDARPTLCGVVGADDREGEALVNAMRAHGLSEEGMLRIPGRPTTVKVRYIGYVQSAHRGIQHMLRVDRETRTPIPADAEQTLLDRVRALMPQQQAVVLSDYDKGLLTDRLLSETIALARKQGIPIIADPKVGRSYSVYRGSTVITPNRYETQVATGIAPNSPEKAREAAQKLIALADLRYALITLDRDGMYLLGEGEPGLAIPTRPKEVYDVTGAGDMVVSVMALLLARGAPARDAAMLANVAAGIEVSKIGAAPVSRAEILADLLAGAGVNRKLRSLAGAIELARETQRRNGKVVWTNGCFDIFHIGHYEYLRSARAQGDLLIVGLNSDASVRRLKGPSRPITGETERARLLAALEVVDCIVVYDDDTPINALKAIRPDVLVKGGDYHNEQEVVGWDIVKAYGGRVYLAPFVEGASTTNIVKRVLELYGGKG